MQSRSKLVNKLALVLLSIVVLELILIGDQVQPVKSIKKKIYLKKLKKILPLLALVKPKKKLILLPIPIPMFKKEPFHDNFGSHPHHQHMVMGPTQTVSMAGSNEAMSFMMMEPMGPIGLSPTIMQHGESEQAAMTMPSMTMTIQSDGTGTMSAIELSPNRPTMSSNNSAMTGSLIRPGDSKWAEQQQYDYLMDEQFEIYRPGQQRPREGDHYYASPWGTAAQANTAHRSPLVSPAKFLRNGRLRQRPQPVQSQKQRWISPTRKPSEQSGRLEAPPAQAQPVRQQTIAMITTSSQPKKQAAQKLPATMPVLVIKNHWRPSGAKDNSYQQQRQQHSHSDYEAKHSPEVASSMSHPQPKLSKQQEQQIASALEQESLVQVGPARMVPIYQSPNGRISMTPPPSMAAPAGISQDAINGSESRSSTHGEPTPSLTEPNADSEVQTNSQLVNSVFRPSTIPTPAAHSTSGSHDHSFDQEATIQSMPTSEAPISSRLTAAKSKRPTEIKMEMMPMMDNYDMPMDYQQQQSYSGGGGGGSGGGGQSQGGY